MTPEDVPNNILEALLAAADDVCVEMPPFEAARILCALLPVHERMVREQVAAELEADADAVEENSAPHPATAAHVSTLRAAARSARGETR